MDPTRRELAAEAWGKLLRAHARLVPLLDAALRDRHGLPLSHYDVLLVLRRAPDFRLTLTDLSTCVVLSRSRVSRVVDDLARAGLVSREENLDDRRSAYAVLSTTGRDALRAASPTYLRLIERNVAAPYSDAELRRLANLLARLVSDSVSDAR